mgnify:FL=1
MRFDTGTRKFFVLLLINLFFASSFAFGADVSAARRKPKSSRQSYNATTDTVNAIVDYSRSFLGTRYRYGGNTPQGFDCSGFMVYIFKNFSVDLPRTGTEQYHSYPNVKRKNIKKGDLVFFAGRRHGKRIGHVGMVVSDSVENGVFEFIHSSTQRGVIVSKSSEPYYASRYISAARVFGKISDTSPSMPEETECIEQTEVADGLFHIVRRGETLYSIAKHYRISVDSLKALNDLSGNNIGIGQRLLVSALPNDYADKRYEPAIVEDNDYTCTEDTRETSHSSKTIKHTVKKGETLFSIAKRYRTTVEKIKRANNLKSDSLKIGQKLKIKK